MSEPRTFADVVARSLRHVFHPWALLTALPTAGATLALALLGWDLAARVGLPAAGQTVAALVFSTPLAGRWALNAAVGRWDAGVFGDAPLAATLRFSLRYLILTGAWGTLWALAAHVLVLNRADLSLNVVDPSSAAGLGLGAALILVGLVLHLASVQLAVAGLNATELRRAFAGGTDWLLTLTATLGAYGLAALVLTPILLGLAYLAGLASPAAAIAVGVAAYLLPVAIPLLVGARVAGGRVWALEHPADFTLAPLAKEPEPEPIEIAASDGEPMVVTPNVPTRAPRPPEGTVRLTERVARKRNARSPAPDALDLIKAFQNLQVKAKSDLDGAINNGEALRDDNPTTAGVVGELAKLYRMAGRDADAVQAASEAITLAVNGGMGPVAVEVYTSFVSHRDDLELNAEVRAQLGKILRAQGRDEDAAWCLGS